MKLKIGIITCWYGPFPWYFPYFIHSCSCNPTIDFFIITDNQHTIPNKPKNVKIVNQTLEEIKIIASEKLGFAVNIDYPYKLCDFKPAYGFLFPEIIRDYDFWGHGDIDVMYGDLRNFLAKRLLETYDVFSFRPEYLTGCLTIFRNTKKINELFMQSKDYKTVFTQSKYFNFDECNFMFVSIWDEKPIKTIHNEIESMTHVVKKKSKEGYLSAYFDFNLIEVAIGNIKWTNGKIIYKNKIEAILYHLLSFKKVYQYKNQKVQIQKNETICFSKNNIYKRRAK
jgi:hypothetical protein